MEPSKGKSPTACALCAPRSSNSTTTTLTHPNRRAFELLAKQKEQYFSSTLNTTKTSIMVSRCPSVCSLERRYEILCTRNLFSDSLKSPYPLPLLCLPSKAVDHSTATADPARLLDAPAVPRRISGSSFSLLPLRFTFDFVSLSPSRPCLLRLACLWYESHRTAVVFLWFPHFSFPPDNPVRNLALLLNSSTCTWPQLLSQPACASPTAKPRVHC